MFIELIILILIIFFLYGSFKKPSNYPPGPWGLPLIGHLPFGLKQFEDKFQELKKKHGNIFSWRMGSQLIIFLCDFKLIKEAYNSPNFANRPRLLFLSFIDESSIGVLNTSGAHWNNIRRFTIRHLRDLGMGKSKLVLAVQHEALEYANSLRKQAGKAAPLPRSLKPAVLNVMWQMVASKRYAGDHKNIIEFDNLMIKLQDNLASLMVVDVFTWIPSVLPEKLINFLFKKNIHMELAEGMKKFFKEEIEEHIATFDENNSRDYIDDYLIEMKKQKENPDSTMSTHDLMGCISDLFDTSTETTSATLHFCIFYLAKYQEIQHKLQKEIDDVLPCDILATLDDRARLPYTEAFINESLRYSTLARFGIPHTVLTDTELAGYTIPKNSIVMSATAAIHFDPAFFESPEEFRPERFLNSEGKFEIAKAEFFPFGIGKRQCLGESLARTELLIFLTTMLKYVSFSSPPDKDVDIRPMDIPMFNTPRHEQEVVITVRQ